MTWASAKQLAGLPGFPGSDRRAREKAKRMGLPSRPRTNRAGGRQWLLPVKPHFKLHLDGRISLIRQERPL